MKLHAYELLHFDVTSKYFEQYFYIDDIRKNI